MLPTVTTSPIFVAPLATTLRTRPLRPNDNGVGVGAGAGDEDAFARGVTFPINEAVRNSATMDSNGRASTSKPLPVGGVVEVFVVGCLIKQKR
jgi:hypothetical protein